MATRDTVLDKIMESLKEIDKNTKSKPIPSDTKNLEKKIDQMIEIQEKQIELLQLLTRDRCTCKKGKSKKEKKEKKEKKSKKDK